MKTTAQATVAGYPRSVDAAITRLYEGATDAQQPMLDDILRRAGLRWDHVGCWTNTARSRTCQECGGRRSTLEDRGEVLA